MGFFEDFGFFVGFLRIWGFFVGFLTILDGKNVRTLASLEKHKRLVGDLFFFRKWPCGTIYEAECENPRGQLSCDSFSKVLGWESFL